MNESHAGKIFPAQLFCFRQPATFFIAIFHFFQTSNMKKLLLGAFAATMLFTACKKNDDDDKPANTWKVGNDSYTAVQVANNGMGLTASTTTNSIAFAFSGNALPTASGTYTVGSSTSGTNSVTVIATDIATQGAYIVQSGTVTVTVKDGKVSASLPASNAKYTGQTAKADVLVSANITQD
jgi:hypothetical protein